MAHNNNSFAEAKRNYRKFSQVLTDPPQLDNNNFPKVSSHNKYQLLSSDDEEKEVQINGIQSFRKPKNHNYYSKT